MTPTWLQLRFFSQSRSAGSQLSPDKEMQYSGPRPPNTKDPMSSIPPAVRQAMAAKNDALQQQVNTAIARKGLDAQQQAGDAINQLLEQAVSVQKQLAAGRIDVKV
jgi:hypothetical protein